MKTSTKEIFIHNKNDWEIIGNGLARQITGYNATIMMVKVKFDNGAIGELHNHRHSQASYVASGQFELTIDNNTQIIDQGDSFIIVLNKVHGVRCLKKGY